MPGRTWNVCSAAPLLKARCALMESMLTTSTLGTGVGRVAEAVLHPDRELHGLGCDVEREGVDTLASPVAMMRPVTSPYCAASSFAVGSTFRGP